jgi:hypothetical protein
MYSRQSKGRKGPTVKSKRGHRHGKRPAPQVGEYVQWTSDGVDQFKPARKVTQIQDRYVWVDSADLDVKGLGKLKQMLEQYEQILKLLQ